MRPAARGFIVICDGPVAATVDRAAIGAPEVLIDIVVAALVYAGVRPGEIAVGGPTAPSGPGWTAARAMAVAAACASIPFRRRFPSTRGCPDGVRWGHGGAFRCFGFAGGGSGPVTEPATGRTEPRGLGLGVALDEQVGADHEQCDCVPGQDGQSDPGGEGVVQGSAGGHIGADLAGQEPHDGVVEAGR